MIFVLHSWLGRSADSGPATVRVSGKVRVVTPVAGGLPRVCLQPATVQSWDIVNLYAEVSGILTGQTVDINSAVKKDQILANIYAPDVVKERDLATAALAREQVQIVLAEKELDAARANHVATQVLVQMLQAEGLSAQATFDFRAKKMERYRRLTEANAIEFKLLDYEEDKYQDALSRNEDAKAGLDKARESEKTWKARVDEAEANVRIARLSVAVARATLDKAQVFVDFTQIKAPFDGVITHRSFNNGAFIRPKGQGGQVPLLTDRRTDKFRVVVDMPDVDVPYVQVGDPVNLKIYSLGMEFPGRVDRLALSESPASRLMRAEIDLYNDGLKKGDKKGAGKGLLQDGMYGEVAIRLGTMARVDPAVVTIPSVCLQEGEGGGKKVFVVRPAPDHMYRIDEVTVRVGYNDGQNAEILSGLARNDRVVVESRGLVSKGALVELVTD